MSQNDDINRMARDIATDAVEDMLIPPFKQRELEYLIKKHAESVVEKDQKRFMSLFRKLLKAKRGLLP